MPDEIEEAKNESKQTRKRRPKGQSMPVMKELLGLMDERTKILALIRSKRMEISSKQGELAQLESSMQSLATEIQWRANIFGMVQKDPNEIQPISAPPSIPVQWPQAPQGAGVILASPLSQFDLSNQTGPQPPQRRSDGINRGMADLGNLS